MAHPPLKIFIMYAREDIDLRKELAKYLSPLERNGLLDVWTDEQIPPGAEWDKNIKNRLEQTDLFLPLVSIDFHHSTYIQEIELPFAEAQRKAGKSHIIPIVVRECNFQWFEIIRDLQVLPPEGKAVDDPDHWRTRSKAWTLVTEEIAKHAVQVRDHAERAIRETAEEAAEQKRKALKAQNPASAIGLEMVFVEGGTFNMGDEHGDLWNSCRPVYQVAVPDFYISKYPVTQKQWKEIMGNNPSRFPGDDLPVENVSWQDCKVFLDKLNTRYPGIHYRLPTEAEWEYAARGGKHSKGYQYSGSNELDEVGWYKQNSDGKTHPVGQKKANELGLFDMSGNVEEWCEDHWHDDYNQPGRPDNGAAWVDKNADAAADRVRRGGSWGHDPRDCRVAFRGYGPLAFRWHGLGFRPAFPPRLNGLPFPVVR